LAAQSKSVKLAAGEKVSGLGGGAWPGGWRVRPETTMTLTWTAQGLNMGAAGSVADLVRDTERKE
jgi:hypothetical protein